MENKQNLFWRITSRWYFWLILQFIVLIGGELVGYFAYKKNFPEGENYFIDFSLWKAPLRFMLAPMLIIRSYFLSQIQSSFFDTIIFFLIAIYVVLFIYFSFYLAKNKPNFKRGIILFFSLFLIFTFSYLYLCFKIPPFGISASPSLPLGNDMLE